MNIIELKHNEISAIAGGHDTKRALIGLGAIIAAGALVLSNPDSTKALSVLGVPVLAYTLYCNADSFFYITYNILESVGDTILLPLDIIMRSRGHYATEKRHRDSWL